LRGKHNSYNMQHISVLYLFCALLQTAKLALEKYIRPALIMRCKEHVTEVYISRNVTIQVRHFVPSAIRNTISCVSGSISGVDFARFRRIDRERNAQLIVAKGLGIKLKTRIVTAEYLHQCEAHRRDDAL
jgi:hypothetical protein